VPRALVALAERAGTPVWIPPDVAGTCCAAPWHARGLTGGTAAMANRIVEQAWMWTGGGRLPLVVDAGACTLGLSRDVVPYLTEANRELHGELTIVDSVVWAARQLLPRLTVTRRAASAALHPTCAMRQVCHDPAGGAGGEDAGTTALEAVARACADEVVVPDDSGCCALAADRGPLLEELTGAATRREAEEVAAREYDVHLSVDRWCELAMEHATGEPYEPVLAALERATRERPEPGDGGRGPQDRPRAAEEPRPAEPRTQPREGAPDGARPEGR
jgi:D-lactate dehydrogenase